jgi:DNA-directed RNA polymerase specialized sigma24 family protein
MRADPKLYDRMFSHLVRNFRGDHDLAHDAAVDVWLEVVRGDLNGFKSERALIAACLRRSTWRALDILRRGRRLITGCGELIEKVEVDHEGDRIREQARHELAKVRARLPHLQQHVITLYYEENFSHFDIAELLLSGSRGRDAGVKFIQRARRAALESMRHWLEESGVNPDSLAAAFPSLN